jgi:alpha-tubulin suppressor-like RCC1 family protein
MHIATGTFHTILISDNGKIWAIGSNEYGQLGLGPGYNEYINVPTEIQRGLNGLSEDVRIISASCGQSHTVLLSDDGRVWTFGDNEYGQLGLGDFLNRSVPTEIQRGLNGLLEDVKIIGVSCGDYNTVLLSEDGKHIWTFGQNSSGQLGHKRTENINVPTEIQRRANELPEDVNIVKASCSSHHTVLLSDDGRIWIFGNSTSAYLVPIIAITNLPIDFQIQRGVKFVNISCGYDHMILLSDDGRIWAAGYNSDGQLGLGIEDITSMLTEIQRVKPGEYGLPKDININNVNCGDNYTVLLSENGKNILTFGSNSDGQLGLGMGNRENRNVPTEIQRRENELPEDVRIIDTSCFGCHTVLLSDDGRIWTFGSNSSGQLGLGDNKNENINVPTEIPNFSLRDIAYKKSAYKT